MKKKFFNSVSMLLTAAFVVTAVAPVADAEAAKAPKLDKTKVTVKVGKKVTLKVKNTRKKASWSIKSGKSSITLASKKKSSVVVKGKKKGSAVVLAKVAGKKLTCKVTVKKTATVVDETPAVTQVPTVTQTPEVTVTVKTETPQPTNTAVPTPEPGPAYPSTEFTYQGLNAAYVMSINKSKPSIAFTFDDGPVGTKDTDNSMIIQNSLAKHGAHATFFYIGDSINGKDKEEEIKMAVANGFEVGNHSSAWSSLTAKEDAIKKTVEDTNKKLSDITGFENFLFRAPNLSYNKNMFKYINAPLIDCGCDSKDWTGADADTIYKNVTENAKDGDIVLMHEYNTKTAETIDKLLDYYVEKGWNVLSVSELFAVKEKKLMTGLKYNNAKNAGVAQ